MIKRYQRNICYRYAYGTDASQTCTWVEDCTAKNAAVEKATTALEKAQKAEEKAKKKYENAKELHENLQKEKKGIQDCIDEYDNNYNMLANSGMTFLTEQNVNCLNEGAKCLQDYYNAVEDARKAAIKEKMSCYTAWQTAITNRRICETNLKNAQAQPCDSKCV